MKRSFGLRHVFNYESAFANVLKVTMEAQLGLIGGTMGLLTGFSILSGVEIIYYLLRCFFGFSLIRLLNSQVLCVSQGPQSCGSLI